MASMVTWAIKLLDRCGLPALWPIQALTVCEMSIRALQPLSHSRDLHDRALSAFGAY